MNSYATLVNFFLIPFCSFDFAQSYLSIDDNCIDDLGCFPLTQEYFHPVYRPISVYPWNRKLVNTRFTLYRRDIPAGKALKISELERHRSSFQSNASIKFLLPGWLDNKILAKWMLDIKEALLAHQDGSVILVEWNNFTPYFIAAANTRIVGAEVAHMIRHLNKTTSIRLENIHLIGHSLGAHIAGYAGTASHGRLGRITALDPARPYFENMSPLIRLDKSDALQVDAIHSDLGPRFPFGFLKPLGHVDFYPNKVAQPGCEKDMLFRGFKESLKSNLFTGLVQGIRYSVSCAHQRALEFYHETLTNHPCPFIGVKCDSYKEFANAECTCDDSEFACIAMGTDKRLDDTSLARIAREPGKWFLYTGEEEPYCLFQYHVVVQLGRFERRNRKVLGTLNVKLHGKERRHDFRAEMTSKDGFLYSEQRLPYLVASRGRVWSPESPQMVSILWTYDENHSISEKNLPEITLKYVKIVPVAVRSDHEQLTRFYCGHGNDSYLKLKPFVTVTLEPLLIC